MYAFIQAGALDFEFPALQVERKLRKVNRKKDVTRKQ